MKMPLHKVFFMLSHSKEKIIKLELFDLSFTDEQDFQNLNIF